MKGPYRVLGLPGMLADCGCKYFHHDPITGKISQYNLVQLGTLDSDEWVYALERSPADRQYALECNRRVVAWTRDHIGENEIVC